MDKARSYLSLSKGSPSLPKMTNQMNIEKLAFYNARQWNFHSNEEDKNLPLSCSEEFMMKGD